MGEYTSNKYFYKPGLGASGQAEKDLFDAALDAADSRLAEAVTTDILNTKGQVIIGGATGTPDVIDIGADDSILVARSAEDLGAIWTKTLSDVTLTTPTIGSFVNAQHDHADAAGGGNTLDTPTIANFTNAQHNHSDAASGGVIDEPFPDGKQQFQNMLNNGNFERWSDGTSSAPDGWELSGSGATVGRNDANKKIGSYSCALTRNGSDLWLIQQASTDVYWQSRTLTLGCWVKASAASRAYLYLYDSAGTTTTSHSGSGNWEWLTVTHTVSAAATYVRVGFRILYGDTTAYFDGAILVEGSYAPSFVNSLKDLRMRTYGGTFTSPASNGNQSITGVGFTPALVQFWIRWSSGSNILICMGYMTEDSQGCQYSKGSGEGSATDFYAEDYTDTAAFGYYGRASYVSMDTDGFTLNWTDDPSSSDHIFFTAWGYL